MCGTQGDLRFGLRMGDRDSLAARGDRALEWILGMETKSAVRFGGPRSLALWGIQTCFNEKNG